MSLFGHPQIFGTTLQDAFHRCNDGGPSANAKETVAIRIGPVDVRIPRLFALMRFPHPGDKVPKTIEAQVPQEAIDGLLQTTDTASALASQDVALFRQALFDVMICGQILVSTTKPGIELLVHVLKTLQPKGLEVISHHLADYLVRLDRCMRFTGAI